MTVNPAVSYSAGQLKWINLKGVTAETRAHNAQKPKQKDDGGSAEFSAMLAGQAAAASASANETARTAPLPDLDDPQLLWMTIGATGETETARTFEAAAPAAGSAGSEPGKPTEYDDLIAAASAKYGVPTDLIKAVIDTESSFNPNVVSSAGAKGLMQLMDGTAAGLGVSDPFDPAQSIDGGVRYLSYQLKRFGGEENMALAAYNAGPGRVLKLGVSSDEELMQQLEQLPEETQAYIGKIERARAKYAL